MGGLILSLVAHAMGAAVLSRFEMPEPEPETVLEVAFVSRSPEPRGPEPTPQPAAEPSPQPSQAPRTAPKARARPEPAQPAPTIDAPVPPEIEFAALYAAAQNRPRQPLDLLDRSEGFVSWEQRRSDAGIPEHLRARAGGLPDGDAVIDSEGVDRCQPAEGRAVDRLYLLFDSSGSMSSDLRNRALSCAQQYAGAVIDAGGDVVVGNFAGTTVFQSSTRNPTDVAFALRAENDARATLLPSKRLNPFFDEAPGAVADLVILSDGIIPNLRDVAPWYRYFLRMHPENRGYLYTLGTRAPPDVAAALRRIGFEIRIYRTRPLHRRRR